MVPTLPGALEVAQRLLVVGQRSPLRCHRGLLEFLLLLFKARWRLPGFSGLATTFTSSSPASGQVTVQMGSGAPAWSGAVGLHLREGQGGSQRGPERVADGRRFNLLCGRQAGGGHGEQERQSRPAHRAILAADRMGPQKGPNDRNDRGRSSGWQSARYALGSRRAQRHDRDKSGPRVSGRIESVAGRRQRDRRRPHRCCRSRRDRALDDRHRRRPLCDRLGCETKTLHGLDASGRSPYAATPEELAQRGCREMPADGVLSVDVPGVVEGWHQLRARFGSMPFARLLLPAIRYAHDGFPVQEILAADWQGSEEKLAARSKPQPTRFCQRAVLPGPVSCSAIPTCAKSLSYDRRWRARRFLQRANRRCDRRRHQNAQGAARAIVISNITRPTGLRRSRATIAAYDLHELPPSTQGFVALEMLNILEGFDVGALGHNAPTTCTLRRGQEDRVRGSQRVPCRSCAHAAGQLETLISKEYAADRRREIGSTAPRATSARERARGCRSPRAAIAATRSF